MKRKLTALTVTVAAFALAAPTASAAPSATSKGENGYVSVTCTQTGADNRVHSYSCDIKNLYSGRDTNIHAWMSLSVVRNGKKQTSSYENPFGKGRSYTVYIGNVEAGRGIEFHAFSAYHSGGGVKDIGPVAYL
ncbi:hypothetical protein [Kribbella solani]|uniref:Ig-like domain-containing protein n=1 Tax=Kribbella solani TaxID=236067 RepID=A0A841E0B4_9ACTN|nr:hypothetical protein [Kribbella solani]MBB5982476.1 hypothetical protein [Kribbella solani]